MVGMRASDAAVRLLDDGSESVGLDAAGAQLRVVGRNRL
jgi:hypothetical protein